MHLTDRSHRKSPVTKTTAVERVQENLRLARKLEKQYFWNNFRPATINTKKLEKIHE